MTAHAQPWNVSTFAYHSYGNNPRLGSAREPYLNFLRNLGPQILISSLAWVLGSKLDFTKWDLSDAPTTIMFFGFLLLFLYAVYANTSIFLKAAFPTFEPWLRAQESNIKGTNTSRPMIPLLLFKAIFTYKKVEFFLVSIVSVCIQFLIAGVFVSSIISALSIITAMDG